ncbi:MAG: stage 0 sporulation family protein [Eubacterium sp.]|nr:stage 0 sporulation family protein [Eubacterium sp.]
MINVAGVKFRNNGKVYYFDPLDFKNLEIGCGVIVETARGLEFGYIAMQPNVIKDSNIVKPLKPIVRIATEEDIKRKEENENKKSEAMRICQEKIDKRELEMKLIDVEYTFDNNKIVFYFTADGRIDFRELVKDLASVFRMRIELRQVGVRDEAKILGGCGPCGKGLCCASWLADFQPVSIKMAKNQNLSLNPSKISGICGRLMCCLKYENEVYTELRKGMPEQGETVKTDDGLARVLDTNIFRETVRVRLCTGEKDEDGNDKLSEDIYTYRKDAIKRPYSRNKGNKDRTPKRDYNSDHEILNEVDDEYKAELEQLLKND